MPAILPLIKTAAERDKNKASDIFRKPFFRKYSDNIRQENSATAVIKFGSKSDMHEKNREIINFGVKKSFRQYISDVILVKKEG